LKISQENKLLKIFFDKNLKKYNLKQHKKMLKTRGLSLF
jgi:hypothetical protein